MYGLGFDIGGTKCAAVLGTLENGECRITAKKKIMTGAYPSWRETVSELFSLADGMLRENGISVDRLCGIGISCGGPLDSENGLILSPPNLPGWDSVPIVRAANEHFGVNAFLANDADASAVAEWKFGAGKGCGNMVFLTFGTGMGAGLILGGRLYTGAGGRAGEVGHIRLCEDGPVGYGKKGSFEGFCSGGGIARSAEYYAESCRNRGISSQLYSKKGALSAKDIALAAENGDEFACFVMDSCAEKLGLGLSVIIDILNPERIVIGSIYSRNREFFDEKLAPVLKKEALAGSLADCEILPSALGEGIGDYAALGVAFFGGKDGFCV